MKTENLGKKHPVIGIIATSFHSDFSRMVVSKICSRFEGEDIEIHLYLGMDASRYLPGYDDAEVGMIRHYYSLFGYSSFDDLDLMIISGEAVYTESMSPDMQGLLSILPDVPTIIFSSNEGDGAIHINVDNYNGMHDLIAHLVTEHGKRRIAFVSGRWYIPDSAQRLKAYKDCVSEFGLDDDPELIVYGNFSTHCDEVIEPLLHLDPLPEAIVCANDEMAVSAYRVIKAHGLRVGEDIAVTGFDDIQVAEAMDPPLTTVRQRFDDVAELVGKIAHEILAGGSAEDQIIPVTQIIRSSCGCNSTYSVTEDAEEAISEESLNYLLNKYQDLKNAHLREMEAVLLLRSLLMQPVTLEGFFEKLGRQLRIAGVEHSIVVLCEEPIPVPSDAGMFVPEKTTLVMVLSGDEVYSYELDKAEDLYRDHSLETGKARQILTHSSGGTWCTFLLFYGDVQYGAWTVKLELQDVLFYYTLSLEIGSALRYMYLALDQQETHRLLQMRNEILDFTASHDDLTGLYNRAGIMEFCYQYIQDHRRQDYFVAVMADLDHLKQINDTFGHDEGDYAIRKAGEILSKSLPEGAKMGRSGGDEFIGVFVSSTAWNEYNLEKKVREACEKENASNGKPYYVEISVGCHTFWRESVQYGLTNIFKKADQKLYMDKKKRRESVVK